MNTVDGNLDDDGSASSSGRGPSDSGPVAFRRSMIAAGPRAWPGMRSAGLALMIGIVLLAGSHASLRRSGRTLPVRAQGDPASAPLVEGHLLRHRWLYLQNNFQVSANVERVIGILDRAAAAGFNGVVFPDVKLGRLEDGSLPERYYSQLATVLEHADGLGLAVLPAAADVGYSESLLWHDPNLAATLPVRGAPFVARGDRLVAVDDPPLRLANGDFESLPGSGDAFPGWAWQDEPGRTTFVDRAIRHSGQASLRMESPGVTNPPHGNARIQQRLQVGAFRHVHASVWVRTEGFRGGEVRLLVLGQNPSRTLQWNPVPVSETQDWTRFDVTFNSLDHEAVLLYLGVWGGGRGTIWWDDAKVEPAGLFNLARRPGAPVRIQSEDGATVFEEGRDVDPLQDPKSGNVKWPGDFDLWHEAPPITLPAGSRIREGQRLRLDWHHVPLIHGEQVTAALNEPAVYDLIAGQLKSTRRHFDASMAFDGWFLGYDEIRVHGWDETVAPGDGSPGAALAASIARVHQRARAIDARAPLWVWSDMFDPHHNAAERDEPYYLVNGDWSGSWAGLEPEIGVVNWNRGAARRDSAAFFAERGHRQILAGYYDAAPGRFTDRAWLADLSGLWGIDGVMYTQWGSGFDGIEAWAEHVWGDAAWAPVTPTPGVGTPAPGVTPTSAARPTPAATAPTPLGRVLLPQLLR